MSEEIDIDTTEKTTAPGRTLDGTVLASPIGASVRWMPFARVG